MNNIIRKQYIIKGLLEDNTLFMTKLKYNNIRFNLVDSKVKIPFFSPMEETLIINLNISYDMIDEVDDLISELTKLVGVSIL